MAEIRLDPFVRALMADTAAATRSLAVGQQWTGRVVQALAGDRFIITLGDLRLLAESSLPLAAGQRIAVEVVRAGETTELRLQSVAPSGADDPVLRLVSEPRLGSGEVRAPMPEAAVGRGSFAVGERWTGRVVQVLPDERYVLQLGELRVLGQSALQLAEGDRLEIEVAATGGGVELRIRSALPRGAGEQAVRLLAEFPPGPADARASSASPAAALPSRFAVGQQLAGQVAQVLGDTRYVLAFGDLRVLADSSLPLVAGESIDLDVVKSGADVECHLRAALPPGAGNRTLRLLPGPTDAAILRDSSPGSEPTAEVAARNYELAAVLNALSAARTRGIPNRESAARAAAALRQSVAENLEAPGAPSGMPSAGPKEPPTVRLAPPDAEALIRILQPLPTHAGAPEAAVALREWLTSGGFLFEAHLRAILAAVPPATGDEAVAALRDDLKTLLGRLRTSARAGSTSAEAVDEDAGGGGAQAVSGDARTAADAPVPPHELVADRLLGDQVELAYRWIHEGALTFEVPVRLPDGERLALVQFRRERRSSAGEEQAPDGSAISVHVDSPAFGPVHATARWRGRECGASFFVARPVARDALTTHLESLEAGLGVLFDRVSVEVTLDEVRARRPSTATRGTTPKGGGIVSVRI